MRCVIVRVMGWSLMGTLLTLPVSVQELALEEILREYAQEPFFQSHQGVHPQEDIDSLADIHAIGTFLGKLMTSGLREGTYSNKYQIHRFLPHDEQEKMGADIISFLEDAQVDAIVNVQRILSAYLKEAFAYPLETSEILAVLIILYNGFYRQNLQAIADNYTPEVLAFLDPQTLGLAHHYQEWPGKTQLILPLRLSASEATLSSSSFLEDPQFTQFLQRYPLLTSLLPQLYPKPPTPQESVVLPPLQRQGKILIPAQMGPSQIHLEQITIPLFLPQGTMFHQHSQVSLLTLRHSAMQDPTVWESPMLALNQDKLLGILSTEKAQPGSLILLERTEDFSLYRISGVLSNPHTLTIEPEGTLLVLFTLEDYWYLGRLDGELNIIRIAPVRVNPTSAILTEAYEIKVQGLDTRTYTLDRKTLTVLEILHAPLG